MIGRLVVLALGAFAAWRFLARRSRPDERVTIGWEDGSSVSLDPGAPERDRLVEVAREAVG
jgi:hypothetical protein